MNIKQTLIDNNISQANLASHLGISKSSVNLIVNHGKYPKNPPKAVLIPAINQFFTDRGIKFSHTTASTSLSQREARGDLDNQTTTQEDIDMFIQSKGLSQKARKHFGVFTNPFIQDVTCDEQMYHNENTHHIREQLYEAVRNSGFKAIIGEVGSGKSTIREDFIERVEAHEQAFVLIQPSIKQSADSLNKGKILKAGDIEEAILLELDPTARPRRSTQARAKQIQDCLESSYKLGYRHLLIIEEAHSLSTHTLRCLKRFHESKLGRKRLLGIVLIGQPELAEKLSPKKADVREVVQRCEIIDVEPLPPTEISDYLTLKLKGSRCSLDKLIDQSGIEAIAQKLIINTHPHNPRVNKVMSMLYPLAINNLMTQAMNKASEIGIPVINADLINEV